MSGAKRGPAPTRQLSAVKDGNPGKRPVAEQKKLPPAMPTEPEWVEVFPSPPEVPRSRKGPEATKARADRRRLQADAVRARKVARAAWRRWARVLHKQGYLSEVDPEVLQDAAVEWAEIDKCTRDISRRGTWVEGERGAVKNPSVTAVAQHRVAFKNHAAALGLAPAYRVGLISSWDPGGSGDEESPWDWAGSA